MEFLKIFVMMIYDMFPMEILLKCLNNGTALFAYKIIKHIVETTLAEDTIVI